MNCKDFLNECDSLNGCYIMGPTGPRGFQGIPGVTGPTGPQGNPGEIGPAPQLTIGTVDTGPPGSQASVNITPID